MVTLQSVGTAIHLYHWIHRFNYLLPLPRGRWMLQRFACRFSAIPSRLEDVRIDYRMLMDLDLHDSYDDTLIYFNLQAIEIKRAIKRFLQAGQTAIDVGANLGLFTLLMAHRVGREGRVHAFEPNPQIFSRLTAHVLKNTFEKTVTLHRTAVSDRNGALTLFTYPRHHGLSCIVPRPDLPHEATEVNAVTLDALFEAGEIRTPSFVKIDVEGAELLVLKGARQLVERCRPVIIVEVSPKHQKELFGYAPSQLWTWAQEYGYSFRYMHPYKRWPLITSAQAADSLPLGEGNCLLTPEQR